MKSIIVIPARYASSRFPGKPLISVSGKSLLERVYNIASAVTGIEKVLIATDDKRIQDHATAFGAETVMTPESCKNGTERVLATVEKLSFLPDIIINFQGDAVLTPPWIIQAVVDQMAQNPDISMATPATRLTSEQYIALKNSKDNGSSSGTLVTADLQGNALYFSKSMIPFLRNKAPDPLPIFRHIGLYGYTHSMLKKYLELEAGPLEQAEQLEQLRALEHGLSVKVVPVDYRGRTHCAIDNPEDIQIAEQIIEKEGELC